MTILFFKVGDFSHPVGDGGTFFVYAFLENYFTANCQHKSDKIGNHAHLIFRTLSLLNKNNVYIVYYNCNFLYQV